MVSSLQKVGQTAFHLAAKFGHEEAAKVLEPLMKDINDKDSVRCF